MRLTWRDAARFWMKVKPVKRAYRTQCWEYQCNRSPKGYGKFNVLGVPRLAHHVAWVLSGRTLPPPHLCLCHDCDNPPCVRPEHMLVGTRAENNDDMRRKGRDSTPPILRGEAGTASKLTESDVLDIRALHAEGISQRELSRKYGVSKTAITFIVRGETWRHLLLENA